MPTILILPLLVGVLVAALGLRVLVRHVRYGGDARNELSEAERAVLLESQTDRLSAPGSQWGRGAF